MSASPASSNSDKTFTVDPSDNLSYSTTYKMRVTTGVKDSAGNAMGSQYETSSGFRTVGLFVAVGATGSILRSTDKGLSFDNATSTISWEFPGVVFGNNTFVGVGASGSGSDWTDPGSIVRSTDNGSTFNAVTPADSTVLYGVTF